MKPAIEAPRLMLRRALILLVLVAIGSSGIAVGETPKTVAPHTNRLAKESSPYLLMHAHNPVNWYPWCPEAFEKAKKEQKLIFLSVGYSSCYWCHVMERESFENGEVAKLLNDHYVCIKVDREERPEIDNVYQTALGSLSRRGGWPLSMFLYPDGKPCFGGTYWPREDRKLEDGDVASGFKTVLTRLHDFYTERPKDLAEQANMVAERTIEALNGPIHGVALVDLDRKLLERCTQGNTQGVDNTYGGFGSARGGFSGPKFPNSPRLEFLAHQAATTGKEDVGRIVRLTLDQMAAGGIFDQLGGGFHRYSTERTWTVPHFEKMLYDNAQLVELYARAFAWRASPDYRRVVQQTLAFVARELTSPDGAFYSALDAETEGQEGRFYVWTDKQLGQELPSDRAGELFRSVFGISGEPNFEGKHRILRLKKSLSETAAEMKIPVADLEARLAPTQKKLLEARAKRARPFLDTKILAGWNGQMIAGYAVAGKLLYEPKYVAAAARAADFVLTHLRQPNGRLRRVWASVPGQAPEARVNAYLDDYVYFVHGLLCLHDATGQKRWLDEAASLTRVMTMLFGDPKRGGFFFTSTDHEKLFARTKDQYDGPQPSGNSLAARNLVALWKKTGDAEYQAQAQKCLKAFAGILQSSPSQMPMLALALDGLIADQTTLAAQDELPKEGERKRNGGLKSDSRVKITAKTEKPDADGNQAVVLTLDIEKGWHVYAQPVPKEFPGIPISIKKVAGAKDAEIVKTDFPKGKKVPDPDGDYHVYEGQVEIKATVRRAAGDTSALEISVEIQACSDKQCLTPATVRVKAS